MKAEQPRIAVLIPYMAHYRQPFFDALLQLPDVDITVFSGSEPNINIRLAEPHPESSIVQVQNIWRRNFLWQRTVIPHLSSGAFDIVVLFGDAHHLTSWAIATTRRITNRRTFMLGHGLHKDTSVVRSFVRTLYYRLAETHLVFSNQARIRMAASRSLRRKRHIVIYNSLDHRRHVQLRDVAASQDSPYSSDGLNLLFVGRVQQRKRLDLLINSIAILRARGKSATATIVGDGPELPNISRLASRRGVSECVDFIGACYNEDQLSSLFFHADACVCPGPIGLLAIHSMSFGTPVITNNDFGSHGPEVEAVSAGNTGLIFRTNDAYDLANQIERLDSLGQRSAIRKRCYSIVDTNYNPNSQAAIFSNATST